MIIKPDMITLIILSIVSIIYMIILVYFTLRYLIFKKPVLELSDNTKIKRKNFSNIDEYKFNKRIDKVPTKHNRLTVVLLKENKWAKILYFSGDNTHFRYDKCLYFIVTPHTCDNNAKILIYIEGISLPVSYENVQKELVKRKYIDIDGTTKEKEITVIKGLKWDGKILNLFTDRKFAEIFTKVQTDIIPFICLIISIVSVVMIGICIGVSYYYR